MKKIGLFFLVIFVFLTAFYFWAKQSVLSPNEYALKYTFNQRAPLSLPDTFSVMTFNIGYLSGMTNNLPMERELLFLHNNLLAFSGLLKDYKPEILAMQEIDFASKRSNYVNQFEEIASLNHYAYGAKVINWDKKYVPFPYWPFSQHFGEMQSGQALLSQAKIGSHKRIVLPKPQSNPFYYDAFYLDRLAQVLYKQYNKEYPIILCGDFNAQPPFSEKTQEKTIDILLSNPNIQMAIADSIYRKNIHSYYTFNSENPYMKIDYIFYNPSHLKLLEADVLRESGQISDHIPVWARFCFVE
ncbi:MAG: endonuclease/exonuclease/phosphatase [Bacteroidetes bacterium 4572_77]|nr:MAG: endonuclease/exonuclease/phosphatase [Bacteroidetes bacterium 4572_77]